MANMQSAKKRARQTIKRTERNRQIKSSVKTAIRAAREAIMSGGKDMETALKNAISTLSKAATKGTLHKKNASRRISRLAQLAASQMKAASAPNTEPAAAKAAPAAKKPAAKKAAPKKAAPKKASKK